MTRWKTRRDHKKCCQVGIDCIFVTLISDRMREQNDTIRKDMENSVAEKLKCVVRRFIRAFGFVGHIHAQECIKTTLSSSIKDMLLKSIETFKIETLRNIRNAEQQGQTLGLGTFPLPIFKKCFARRTEQLEHRITSQRPVEVHKHSMYDMKNFGGELNHKILFEHHQRLEKTDTRAPNHQN